MAHSIEPGAVKCYAHVLRSNYESSAYETIVDTLRAPSVGVSRAQHAADSPKPLPLNDKPSWNMIDSLDGCLAMQ